MAHVSLQICAHPSAPSDTAAPREIHKAALALEKMNGPRDEPNTLARLEKASSDQPSGTGTELHPGDRVVRLKRQPLQTMSFKVNVMNDLAAYYHIICTKQYAFFIRGLGAGANRAINGMMYGSRESDPSSVAQT